MIFSRIASALMLSSLLAACGGGVVTAAATQTAVATMPAPDCAAEGCASLRIIDGNAEAWRIDAARRAAFEAQLPQS